MARLPWFRRSNRNDFPTHPGLIDRNPQNIPLPVGGFSVVRRRHRVAQLKRWWRRNTVNIFTALGMGAAAAGAILSSTQPAVPVYQSGNFVHVADTVLHPAGSNLFVGNAAFVTAKLPSGQVRAAASTLVRGKNVSGFCQMSFISATQVEESCSFVIGNRTVSADDQLDTAKGGVWHRRYGDGQEVSIQVPSNGSVIPIPFAIGK
jgi:hypothetical protein